MRNCLKKQFTKSIECSFVFLLFVVLFSISVFSIQLNNCSTNGQYYVDTNIYQNLTNVYNWESFVNPMNRSRDYSTFVSPYFNNINNVTGSFDIKTRYERYSPVFCYNDVNYYNLNFVSSSVNKDYYYVVANYFESYLIQINKTLLYSNTSFLLFNDFTQYGWDVPTQTCFVFLRNITFYDNSSLMFNKISISTSTPLITNNYVYIGSTDSYLYQFNIDNISKNVSKFKTNGTITTTPIYLKDYVYVVSNDKYVYQLNSSNISRQISNFTINETISSTLITDNNYLYVFTNNNSFFKLNSSNINQVMQNISYLNNSINMSTTTTSPSLYKEFIYITSNEYLLKFNTSNISNYQYTNFNIVNVFGVNRYKMRTLSSMTISNDNVYMSGSAFNDLRLSFLLQINASNISQLLNYYSPKKDTPVDNYGDISIINGVGYVAMTTDGCLTIFGCNPSKTFMFLADNISNSIGHVNSSITTSSLILIYDNVTHINNANYIKTTMAFDNIYYPLQQCPTIRFVNPTETNGVNINKSYMNINISVNVGTNSITDLSIYITNRTQLLDLFSYVTDKIFLNYTPITNKSYSFNASVTDSRGNIVWTELRNITNLLFYVPPITIIENCFDKIKNQDEIDTDYNGICGYCKNLTFYSDDTSFQVLKESDLYKYPFNQSQCSQGDAVVGSYTFLILLITLGIFVVGGLLLFFFGIPLLIFAITGSFKFSWWNLIFGGKKKKKEEKEEETSQ